MPIHSCCIAIGIADLVKRHPTVTKQFVYHKGKSLSLDDFFNIVGSVQPSEPAENQDFGFFKDFVMTLGGKYTGAVYSNIIIKKVT